MRKIITDARRAAIVLPDGTRLAVPPMHPRTPRDARVRIFEYVLRRQLGLASVTAEIERELIEDRERKARQLARELAQRPHRDDDDGLGGVLAPVVAA